MEAANINLAPRSEAQSSPRVFHNGIQIVNRYIVNTFRRFLGLSNMGCHSFLKVANLSESN